MHFQAIRTTHTARWLTVIASLFLLVAATVSAQKRPVKPQPKAPVQTAQTAPSGAPEWPQWGGPNRNFKVFSGALKESWPAGGPKRLWSRSLGEGHSSILVENGKLYTMYSSSAREYVISLDSATGKMLWEYAYESGRVGFGIR